MSDTNKKVEKKFHLSVVAVSRNDNHGGSLTYRMQHFVSGFIEQCKRHNLNAELILVEWNPPEDRPPLAEALTFPQDLGPCEVRIIRVPKEVHMKLDHSDRQFLYQMIGKNVGIQRARGKFVLATNIDIIFSDEIIRFMRDQLKTGILYRVDRCDIPSDLPQNVSFSQLLSFCRKNYFRINSKYGSIKRIHFPKNVNASFEGYLSLFWAFWLKFVSAAFPMVLKSPFVLLSAVLNGLVFRKKPVNRYDFPFISKRLNHIFSLIVKRIGKIFAHSSSGLFLHTNACGDFTLLSFEDWNRLRGYPEWSMYSWHLDSVFLYQAAYSGIKEVQLHMPNCIYHIEHGSGYTPEASDSLFSRLDKYNIPYLTDKDLERLIQEMKNANDLTLYNDENWSFKGLDFDEVLLSS